MSAINTLGDVRTNATFYDNIHVPDLTLVGEAQSGLVIDYKPTKLRTSGTC